MTISSAFGADAARDLHPLGPSPAVVRPPDIDNSDGRFGRFCNRSHFSFEHDVVACGLFTLPQLVGLAARRPASWEYAYWSRGPVRVGDRWEQGTDPSISLIDTLTHIGENNSFVMLRHAEQDPVFGPVICAILSRIVELCGPAFRDDVITGHSEIIISSPRRVTSYHIDADCNFLFQLAGDKRLRVYPARDREIVTHADLERYHSGDYNGAHYREEHAHLAVDYDLRGGQGVHIPSTAPHSALSGDQVSIGLSCAFDLRSITRQALVYQFNRRLRGWGMEPTPPALSPWRDGLKLFTKQCAELIGRGNRKYTGAAAGEWRPKPMR